MDLLDEYTLAIDIGGDACEVVSTAPGQVQCLTSAQTGGNTLAVDIDGNQGTSTDFSYDAAATPSISNVTPAVGSIMVETSVQIDGAGFGTN